MPEISIDAHEVRELAADFTRVPGELSRHAIPVLSRGALNIKNALNQQAADSLHFKGMAGSVTYDTEIRRHSITAEIGPDKDRRGGALGDLFFFGGANGGGGTGDIDAPLREEEPKMVKFLDEAMGELL